MAQILSKPPLLPPDKFVFWLQGFFEVAKPETITAEQTKMIKEHLEMCFEHVEMPAAPVDRRLSPDIARAVLGPPVDMQTRVYC